MQDKLEEEDIERAKKKLHSKMMDYIEDWLDKKKGARTEANKSSRN